MLIWLGALLIPHYTGRLASMHCMRHAPLSFVADGLIRHPNLVPRLITAARG